MKNIIVDKDDWEKVRSQENANYTKSQGLITDNAISIVFKNTNFGDTPAREVVERNLLKVNEGWAIGHTAKCCLLELGLIYETTKMELAVSKIGYKYLEVLTNN